MSNCVFSGYGVVVRLREPDDFLKVKETLTRIGVASEQRKQLWQSCHILHKRGQYAILHFKELFALDGKHATLDDQDMARRDAIALLLENWGLVDIMTPERLGPPASLRQIKVLPFHEKRDWNLIAKYTIGQKR